MDSDDLDGDLNLSDDESGNGARAAIRNRANKAAKRDRYEVEFDTNIFKVSLDCLQNKGQMATGDAETCSNCKGVFNQSSKLTEEGGQQIWQCEFCNTRNEVMIGEEEIP